jgi:hypothetical protein
MALAMSVVGLCSAQQGNLELLELKTTLEVSARRIGDLEGQLAIQMCRITPKLYVTSAIETPLQTI